MNNIGTKIMLLRKQNEMSQTDLAKKLNVSNKLISKWETGNSLPSTEYLPKLCQIFNIKINELMGEEDFPVVKSAYSVKKLTVITAACMLFFCFFIAFCHLTLAPAVLKKAFIHDIDNHIGKTFSGTHYYLTTTIEVDDVPTVIEEYGYYENGKVEYIEYVDDEIETIIKDGVKYNATSYKREPFDNTQVNSLWDLYEITGEDDDDFDTLEDVSFINYIYKQFNGYYFEVNKGVINRFIDEELSSDIRVTSKIKGDVDFSKGKLKSMTLSFEAKNGNAPINVKITQSFDLKKGHKELNHIEEIESVPWANLVELDLSQYDNNIDVSTIQITNEPIYKSTNYLVSYSFNSEERTIYLFDYDMNLVKTISASEYGQYVSFSTYFNVVGNYIYTSQNYVINSYMCEVLLVIDLTTFEEERIQIEPDSVKYISENQTIYYGYDLWSYNLLTKKKNDLIGIYRFHGNGDIVYTYLSESTDGYSVGLYKITNETSEFISSDNSWTDVYCFNEYLIYYNKLYDQDLQYVKNLLFYGNSVLNSDNNLIFTNRRIFNINNLFTPPIMFKYNISNIIILDNYYLLKQNNIWYKVNKSLLMNLVVGNKKHS